MSLITLIPQLHIVRTQLPFWQNPFSAAHRSKGNGGVWLAMFSSSNWQDFMTHVHDCTFLLDFTFENQGFAMEKIFCFSLYFKIWNFIFRQSESCVLTMLSWSRRVKICGLKSSIEGQLPTVSGHLQKMLYFCLCTSFVSCYCVLMRK